MAADVSIALNRFGLGGRPGQDAPGDARAWLKRQIDSFEPRPARIAAVSTRVQVAGQLAGFYDRQRQLRQQLGPRPRMQKAAAMAWPPPAGQPGMAALATGQATPPAAGSDGRDAAMAARAAMGAEMRREYNGAVGARIDNAILTDTPFMERLVHFWANHFAVSADKLEMVGLAGPFEFEAIRPNLTGKFSDMVNAVERHPAMLLYLDQAVSIGPDSPFAQAAARRGRGGNRGLNENLGREIMELHTLGVRTGYTQADVTEFARALTGWTVGGIGRAPGMRADEGAMGDFVFAPRLHEPGVRTIIGRSYAQQGEAQGQAVLDTLSRSPATAKHVATKLARHFAGDSPSPKLVGRLQSAFLKSDGDLPTLYRTLIDSPECWVAQPVKFKTPWEWSLSVYRALGMKEVQPAAGVGLLNQLGQPTWKPGQPVGYDDIAGSWAGPDALVRRVEAAERFATRWGGNVDARELAAQLFPGTLTPGTQQALSRAESPGQALALLLVSPEMLRR